MASSLLYFGPDLEPLESESRRASRFAGSRRDAVAVDGPSDEVIAKLIAAQSGAGGWCELQQLLADDERRRIYVNVATVRFVVDEAAP
jgi:hypothetical protein